MILRNVKFCSYINTIMRKSIDWLKDEEHYRDLGLTWIAHGNAGNFLETHPSYNKKDEWLNGSPDVLDSYNKTISSGIPKYWRYHKDKFTYDMNSDGFRTMEFDKVDWKNSYVIIGCSHIQGIGNPYKETIGQYISRRLSAPVINLGVGGLSNQAIYNNLLKQITTYGKAKGYFIMWTYPWRHTDMGRYYMQEGYKDFWARGDGVPGLTSNTKFTDDFVNDLMWKRNVVWHSTKMLLQGTPTSYIWEPHCWALEDEGDIMIPIRFPARSNFTSHKTTVHGVPWENQSDEYKEWYLNKICARDIMRYDPKTGPHGSHWGPVVNIEVANYFVDNLSNE